MFLAAMLAAENGNGFTDFMLRETMIGKVTVVYWQLLLAIIVLAALVVLIAVLTAAVAKKARRTEITEEPIDVSEDDAQKAERTEEIIAANNIDGTAVEEDSIADITEIEETPARIVDVEEPEEKPEEAPEEKENAPEGGDEPVADEVEANGEEETSAIREAEEEVTATEASEEETPAEEPQAEEQKDAAQDVEDEPAEGEADKDTEKTEAPAEEPVEESETETAKAEEQPKPAASARTASTPKQTKTKQEADMKKKEEKKPAAKTTAAAPKKKPAAKPVENDSKIVGKFELCNSNLGGFSYILRANNGQLLYESKSYKSLESCREALANFVEAVKAGMFTVRADKFKQYKFILKSPTSNTLIYLGESFSTEASCRNNIESVKRFAPVSPIVDITKQDFVAEFVPYGIPVDDVKAVKDGTGAVGKWEIVKVDDNDKNSPFVAVLYANNGQLLYESRDYKTYSSCLSGLKTFINTVQNGSFYIDPDKSGRYKFVLRSNSGNSSMEYYGQNYDAQSACAKNIESVYRFALRSPLPENK